MFSQESSCLLSIWLYTASPQHADTWPSHLNKQSKANYIQVALNMTASIPWTQSKHGETLQTKAVMLVLTVTANYWPSFKSTAKATKPEPSNTLALKMIDCSIYIPIIGWLANTTKTSQKRRLPGSLNTSRSILSIFFESQYCTNGPRFQKIPVVYKEGSSPRSAVALVTVTTHHPPHPLHPSYPTMWVSPHPPHPIPTHPTPPSEPS